MIVALHAIQLEAVGGPRIELQVVTKEHLKILLLHLSNLCELDCGMAATVLRVLHRDCDFWALQRRHLGLNLFRELCRVWADSRLRSLLQCLLAAGPDSALGPRR